MIQGNNLSARRLIVVSTFNTSDILSRAAQPRLIFPPPFLFHISLQQLFSITEVQEALKEINLEARFGRVGVGGHWYVKNKDLYPFRIS